MDQSSNEDTKTENSVSEAKIEVPADVTNVETSVNNEDSKILDDVTDKNDINKKNTKE